MHEKTDRSFAPSRATDRTFGVVMAAACSILALVPLLKGASPRWLLLVIGCCFLAAALVRPALLGPLNRLWARIGFVLHSIASPVILALLFFLVVTPVGLIVRIFGKSTVRLQEDAAALTYWVRREPPGPARETMVNQF